ncbi:hypothetical protein C8J56DRAFT_890491 [Mycena floridula]|nr:hypothetical protein C8J56DRAFT_890491 [Mycena floridula]
MSEMMQPGPLADSDRFNLYYMPGIYSTIVIIVLYKLWTKKVQSAAQRILIAASITMFVATTVTLSLDLVYSLISLPTFGFDPPNVERPTIIMNILADTLIRMNYLIGDSIVVWRAWVIWTDHSRVHMLLCICLFGTLDSPRFSSLLPRALIQDLPLFLTNFISTMLIAYKVWKYKAEIKQNLNLSHNKRTKIERVLILLTESGSIYCLLWAIYPMIIILLVASEKANLESTVNGPSFSQSLQFASTSQVPIATQSDDDVITTTHIDSVMPDSDTDNRPNLATDDRPDSNTRYRSGRTTWRKDGKTQL